MPILSSHQAVACSTLETDLEDEVESPRDEGGLSWDDIFLADDEMDGAATEL